MAPILNLAPELVEAIATHIPGVKNLQKFRLANKYLERATRKLFGKKFFTERSTDLGTNSLDRLLGIASNDTLAKSVKKICFLEAPEFEGAESGDGPATPSFSKQKRLKDQKSFELLCVILRKLPNLAEIEIGAIGCLSLPKEPVFDTRFTIARSHDSFTYSTLILAINETKIKIKALRMASEIDDRALLDMIKHTQATKNLQELHLSGFSCSKLWLDTTNTTLSQAMAPMTHLRVLHIKAHRSGDVNEQKWINRALQDVKLPLLATLSLCNATAKAKLLRAFVRRHRTTLTDMRLHRLILDDKEEINGLIREALQDPQYRFQSLALCKLSLTSERDLWLEPPDHKTSTQSIIFGCMEQAKVLSWCNNCMVSVTHVPKKQTEGRKGADKKLQLAWSVMPNRYPKEHRNTDESTGYLVTEGRCHQVKYNMEEEKCQGMKRCVGFYYTDIWKDMGVTFGKQGYHSLQHR